MTQIENMVNKIDNERKEKTKQLNDSQQKLYRSSIENNQQSEINNSMSSTEKTIEDITSRISELESSFVHLSQQLAIAKVETEDWEIKLYVLREQQRIISKKLQNKRQSLNVTQILQKG